MKIAFLSGKRGGSGALTPTFRELSKRGHDCYWIATDQHLTSKFGMTHEHLEGDVEKVGWMQHGDSPQHRARAMGLYLMSITEHFGVNEPDIMVLFGDRGETLMTAIAAHQLGIPIAHIQGGDSSGCLDDDMRHAISMLASIHFPSNIDSMIRLNKMGVKGLKGRSVVVGDLHLDLMGERSNWETVKATYGVWDEAYDIVLVHPDTNDPEGAAALFEDAAEAAEAVESPMVIAVYPCSDQGHQAIIDGLESRGLWDIYKNIPQRDFHTLLEHANALIGNSSAGVIECPYLGTKFIEIGNRQKGRYRGDYGDGTAYLQVADALEREYDISTEGTTVSPGESSAIGGNWAY